jgi:RNA polymerase sigma-70 factor, ECF subfamily
LLGATGPRSCAVIVGGMPDMTGVMGDEARFERIYREYADEVHAYARRRSDAATADEVVADVFLVAWRRLEQVPSEGLPWLLGVARRVLANRRRSARRASALSERLVGNQATGQPPEDLGLVSALSALPERDREVLLLIAWEGLSQAEVAEVLSIRRAAVATRLHRARRRLASELSSQGAGREGMEAWR